jgi:AraC-like DNA-binding protein
MRERYAESLSLKEMSEIAISSPFHFNRVFRAVTGLPPARFLAAIRLHTAKHLLLTTRRSVTDICFGVGYSSLGTFTAHFSEYVGAPPSRFRQLSRTTHTRDVLAQIPNARRPPSADAGTIHGHVRAAPGVSVDELAMIGLFPSELPRGHPCACVVAATGTSFVLANVPPGWYHLFSVAINPSVDRVELYLAESMRRGHAGPILVRDTCNTGPVDLELRCPRDTDPPLLIALPLLIAERAAEHAL